MKITVSRITEIMIYLYLLVLMISSNTGDITVKIVRVVIMFFLFLYFVSVNSFKWVRSSYCRLVILFLVYNAIMCEYAFSKKYAVEYTMTLLYVIIVNVFICQFFYVHKNTLFSVLKVFILGALIKAIFLFGRHGMFVFMNNRATGGTSANTVGFYCAFAAVFSFYFYLYEGRKKRYIIFFVFSVCFMFLSASRKALVFLAIPIVFWYLLKNKNVFMVLRNIIIVVIIGWGLTTAILKNPFLYELIGRRIEGMINGLFNKGVADASTRTRLSLIQFGMDFFKQKPWFGYGMSNFKALVEVYRKGGSVYYAHNNYVELLVDCGIWGTVIYYSLYIKMIVSGIKNIKKRETSQILAMGCLLSIVIAEYGMVTYNSAVLQLLLLVFFFFLVDNNINFKEKEYENYIK